jgi:FKBP-type peptidyl-prolyl cis-trans isomerase
VGTEKRERQKTARQTKIEAEQAAAKRSRRKRTAIRAAVAIVVAFGGLFLYSTIWAGGDDNDDESANEEEDTTTSLPTTTQPSYTNPELAEEVLAREPPDPEPPPAETPADTLEISTLIEGEGEGAVGGDTVEVHYVGRLADGTVFDESWGRGETIPVEPLGQAGVIPGWNEGLVGAKIGERRRLVIGSDKAYGPEGNPGGIPPDAPLVFEIDVVDVRPMA